MLTSREIELLRNPNADPKMLGNLNYRIRQKIKKKLREIAEINDVLREFPKTRSALNDEAFFSVLKLADNMLQYLEYVPIKMGRAYGTHIILKRPKLIRSTDGSKEYKIRLEKPTADDFTRQFIMKDHIENLYHLGFINPKLIRKLQYSDDDTELPLFEQHDEILNVSGGEENAYNKGVRKYREITNQDSERK
jgi:hypothetical protein